jgi:hypothetical protein
MFVTKTCFVLKELKTEMLLVSASDFRMLANFSVMLLVMMSNMMIMNAMTKSTSALGVGTFYPSVKYRMILNYCRGVRGL